MADIEKMTWAPEEKIKINSAEEFKEKLNLPELPDTDLKELFKEPIETTKSALQSLRETYLSKEPDLSAIKEFLEKSKIAVVETARKEVEQVAADLDRAVSIETQKMKEGAVEANDAEKLINSAIEWTKKVWWDLWEKAETWLKTAKEAMTNAKSTETMEKLGNMFKNMFEWLGNFFKAIFDFFKNLFLMISWKEALKEATDKIKAKLSPEEIEKTKGEIKATLTESFPWKEKEIQKILDSWEISEEKLQTLHEKIKSGEKLTIKDISSSLPEFNKLFSKEDIERLKIEAKKKIVESIKTWIEKKYPQVNIQWDKLEKLERLSVEYFNISDENSLLLQQIVNNRWWQLKDIYWLLYEVPAKWTGFTFSLISEGIVPLTAIGIDIVETSADIFKVSLWWLWITETISYDELLEKTWSIEHPELLLWLLYRKWWLLFSIMWDISKVASQLVIENMTNSKVRSSSLIKNSAMSNFEKQAENFKNLAKAMGVDESNEILKNASSNLSKIEQNYRIINIIQNETNLANAKLSIWTLLWETIWDEIDSIEKLKRFVLDKNMGLAHINQGLTKASLLNKFWYGASADFFDLNKKLELINKNQINILKNEHLAKGIWKIREIFEIWDVSRLGDRVIYNFDSVDQATKFSTLANKFPDLIWWVFDKLPIITVAWLAMTNEDKLESLKTGFISLIPFVWPIMMLWEGWVKLNDNWEIEIINPIEAGMWGVLLTLDWVFFIKQLIKDWISWAWWYLIKPLKDIYSIWRWSLEAIDSIAKITKSWAIKKALQKWITWVSKIPKYWPIAAAVLAWVVIGWYEYFSEDDKETYSNLVDEWLIDKNWEPTEKLASAIKSWEINQEEKQTLIELIVAKYSPINLEWIELDTSWNKLNISSFNEKIQTYYFMNSETIKELKKYFDIDYSSDNFSFERAA